MSPRISAKRCWNSAINKRAKNSIKKPAFGPVFFVTNSEAKILAGHIIDQIGADFNFIILTFARLI